jgi:hypothetical protein
VGERAVVVRVRIREVEIPCRVLAVVGPMLICNPATVRRPDWPLVGANTRGDAAALASSFVHDHKVAA